jgi:hypothetical protein
MGDFFVVKKKQPGRGILSFFSLFQTLNAISTEQSSTIVFPFPIDTLCLSMGLNKDKRKSD